MRKVSFGILLAVLLLLGGGFWWLRATPPLAPVPAPAAQGPTITWSAPGLLPPGTNQGQILTRTFFPGTSSTTIVTFRSSETLPAVVVETTPSLNGVLAISPTTFGSIVANQNYQLTLTLTAPPEFKKRDFGGTIHIRNNGNSPRTYARPLTVALRTDWSATSTATGVTLSYPVGWSPRGIPGDPYTLVVTNNANPGPLSEASLASTAFFEVRLLGSSPGHLDNLPANPTQLPVDQWFATYFTAGFSVPPSSQALTSVAGYQAIRIELVEVGGLRVHLYVPHGQDVYELSYGMFAPIFVPIYELMLTSLRL